MCEKSAQKKPDQKSWQQLYDERVHDAGQKGKGCGKCIDGRIQFTADSAPVMCNCDLS